MHISALQVIPGNTFEDMANIDLINSYDNHVQCGTMWMYIRVWSKVESNDMLT